MTQHLNARSACDECGRPAILHDGTAFLCERCDIEINGEVENASASRPDDRATAANPSPRSAAVATTSEFACEAMTCPQVPGPSPITGMSVDRSNAGGEHEEVAPFSNSSELVEKIETGTSPGACGTERERVGATNSIPATALGSSPSPRLDTMQTAGALRGNARRVRATLEGRGPVEDWTDGSLAARAVTMSPHGGEPRSVRNSSASTQSQVDATNSLTSQHLPCSEAPTAADSTALSAADFSFDPGPCGFDFEAEVSALEAGWARDILTSSRDTTELAPFPRGAL